MDLYASGELGEHVTDDTEEVFEDILNRSLTRDYFEVLKVTLVGGTLNERDTSSGGSGGGGNDAMDHEDQSMDGSQYNITRASQSAMATEVISELGGKLLRYSMTSTPIVLSVLR